MERRLQMYVMREPTDQMTQLTHHITVQGAVIGKGEDAKLEVAREAAAEQAFNWVKSQLN